MPILLACPHCGKGTAVEEDNVWQGGPCIACGEKSLLPAAAADLGKSAGGYLPEKDWGGSVRQRRFWAALFIAAGPVAALVALALWPVVQRERRIASANNLKRIILALHNYHDTHQRLPPSVVYDRSGKPLYSWRVAILPFMGEQALYDQFDKSQAWDSPANLAISNQALEEFRSPGDTSCAPNGVSYFVVVGGDKFEEYTLLGDSKLQSRFAAVTDGTSNTIAVMELKGIAGSWAAPNDPKLDELHLVVGSQAGELQAVQAAGLQVAMADGSIAFLPNTTDSETIRRLLSRSEGLEVEVPDRDGAFR